MANPAFVQQTGAASSSAVAPLATTNFGSSVTTGNAVVVFVLNGSAFTNQTIPTDTGNNTYVRIVGVTQATLGFACYYAQNVTGGAAFSVTGHTSSTDTVALEAIEISGLSTSGPIVDYFNLAKSASASALTVTMGSPTRNPNDILLMGIAQDQQPAGYTAGNIGGSTGANVATQSSAFWGDSIGTQTQVVSATGSYTGVFTNTNTGNTAAIMIALSNTNLNLHNYGFQTNRLRPHPFSPGLAR